MSLPVIVFSHLDKAGRNIIDNLVRLTNARMSTEGDITVGRIEEPPAIILGVGCDLIYAEHLDSITPNATFYVFASRHSSASKLKSLTVHHPGNPTPEALYGGRPLELSVAYPSLATSLLLELKRGAEELGLSEDYDITFEVTHHGPTSLSKPVVFIEIGSTPEEWEDRRAGEVVARAILNSLRGLKRGLPERVVCVGFGGGHYARKHTALVFKEGYCYGHIIGKRSLTGVEERVVRSAVFKSAEKCKVAVVERKGVPGRVRRALTPLLTEMGLEILYV